MMATKPTTPVRLVAMAFLTALLALGFALAAPLAAQAQSLDGATENLPVGEDSLPTDDVTGGGSGSGSLDLGGGSGSGSGSLDLGGGSGSGSGSLDLGSGGLDLGNLDLSGGNTDLVNNLQGVTDNLNLGDGGGDGRLQACLDALQNLVEVDSGVADLSARLQNLLEQCLGSEVGDVGGSGDLPVDGGSSDLGLGGNTDLTEALNLGDSAGDGRLQACLDALQNLVEVDSGVDNLSDRVQNLLEQCLGTDVSDVGGSGDTGADADAGTDGDGGSDAGADADASAGADTEVDSSQVDVVPQGGVQTGGSAVPDNGSAAGVALAVFAGLTAVGTLSVRRRLGSAA